MSPSNETSLPDVITRIVADELAHRGVDVGDPIGIEELHCKRHGRFFRVDLPEEVEPRRLFVKRREHGAYQADGLEREFAAIQRIAAALEGSPIARSVPRPFAFDPEENVMAVEMLPGRSQMRSLYVASLARFGLVPHRTWLRATGQWLGAFQVATASGARREPETDLETARSLLDGLRLVPGSARSRLERLLAGTGPSSLPEVEVHGDFALRNLLVAPERVHVIDWEHAGPGDATHDVAELFLNLMLPARYFAGQRALAALAGSFVCGWRASTAPLDIAPEAALQGLTAGCVARMAALERGRAAGAMWGRVFDATARTLERVQSGALRIQAAGPTTPR